MARKNDTVQTTEAVEAVPFELKLPDELGAVRPRWIIAMPRNTSVHVYDNYIPLGEATERRPAGAHYECFLVSNKSGKVVRGSDNWYYGKNEFRTLHELKFAIIGLAESLKIKKRTHRTVRVSEDEDDLSDL